MLPTKRKSAMPDCPQITEEKSQVGILDRLYPGTAIIKYIGNGLNFREKKIHPFWTASIQEKSKKLLFCIAIDCENLVLNSWNSSAKRLLAGSWFTEQTVTSELSSLVHRHFFCCKKTIDSAVGTEKATETRRKPKNERKN
jgi:hypothetical protein